jgi:alpha-1,2-mannosyltransferase
MRQMTHAVGSTWRGLFLLTVSAIVSAVALAGLPDHAVAYDLVQVYVPASERVLDGTSPFPGVDDPVLKQNAAYVYPPLTALLAVPLTGFSDTGLQIVGVLGSLSAMLGALWLLGVRDPRCYSVFALWPPTILAWQNANLSVLVVLACALAWRFRDSWPRAGVAMGIGIALKVLLWPLAVWFLATRRVWAAAVAVLVTMAGVLLSWAAIDFQGLTSYPALLERLTEIETVRTPGVSIFSAALELGAPSSLAHVVALGTGALLLAGSVLYARRGDDRASFTLALVAVLAFTPIVWLHYLVVLAVPMAIYRPRLSAVWAIPLVFWLYAVPGWPFELRKLFAVLVVALIACTLVAPGRLVVRRRMVAGVPETSS